VDLAKGAGIRPIMITGDHPKTAAAIAEELDISAEGRAITGAELEKLDDETLERTARECSVYARVNTEHKRRGEDGNLRLHRRLVQREPPTLLDRIHESLRLRACHRRRGGESGLKRKSVHQTVVIPAGESDPS
jgi:hypothetical protein